ncbi:hypothetical protein TMEC54S_01628 [Thauera mechernichensis]
MTGTSGIVPPWVAHLQLDCPVPCGPLNAAHDADRVAPRGAPAPRSAEATDELEQVAVLSSN